MRIEIKPVTNRDFRVSLGPILGQIRQRYLPQIESDTKVHNEGTHMPLRLYTNRLF